MKILNRFRPGSKPLQANPSKQFSNNLSCLFLLRHGQIQGHKTKRFIGQTDTPLDETGVSQALFWKNAFSQIQFNKIYSSSLARCRDTAGLICPEKKITIDERLNEINMGRWDGESFSHIKETRSELFQQRGEQIESFKPPGGESFNDLYNRAAPFFEEVGQNLKSPTLVITHSGVIRVMICHYLGMEPKQLLDVKLGYSHLFLLGNS
ncbi:MAG: histidine phosphatase family protein [Desulfobacteraceae bacterium]|nr:histidine phosphatase family protein [Desulfobacteraceae bacterium]